MTENNIDPYAPTSWQAKNNQFDFVTKSGQRCLLKPLELEEILKIGLMDELDFFGKMLGSDQPQEEKTEEQTKDELLSKAMDPEAFNRLLKTVESVCLECVVKPTLWPRGSVPKPGAIPVADISFEDKVEIFTSVFRGLGEDDMGEFREEQKADMGNMVTIESPTLSAEPDDWSVGQESD